MALTSDGLEIRAGVFPVGAGHILFPTNPFLGVGSVSRALLPCLKKGHTITFCLDLLLAPRHIF